MSSPTTFELNMSVFWIWTKFGPSFGTSCIVVRGVVVEAAGDGFAPIAPPCVAEELALSSAPAVPFPVAFGDAFCAMAVALASAPAAAAASRNLRISRLLGSKKHLKLEGLRNVPGSARGTGKDRQRTSSAGHALTRRISQT